MTPLRAISRRAFLSALIILGGCGARSSLTPPILQAPSQRILFIGNSYTFYNGGLDKILMEMARQGGKEIACISSTSPGKSLEWHWNSGEARKFIANSNADWIVLQDYSLQPLDKRDLMFEYIRKFDGEIKKTHAKTALYMTWSRQNAPENQQTITNAYQQAGKEVGATVVPCGLAWQRVIRERPEIKLYRGDNSHPTVEGTYLNACCFYAVLLGDDPRGLPPIAIHDEGGSARTLSQDVTQYLQRVAWETIQSHL